MKTTKLFFLCILTFLSFSNEMVSQNKPAFGINETKVFYAENYTPPSKIEFVFSGDAEYVKYFFTDLGDEIKKRFLKQNITIAFRYSKNETHYSSNGNLQNNDFLFFLNIDNAVTISENSGYDRNMKFNFNGELKQKDNDAVILSFKTVVKATHDINNKNEEIADYLLNKILVK